jgi:cation transport ATPase
VVRSGEIVSVDGVTDSEALIDYSSLTGESLPIHGVKCEKGEDILSAMLGVHSVSLPAAALPRAPLPELCV